MKFFLALAALAVGLSAADIPDTKAVIEAKAQLEKARAEVAAGLLPASKIVDAQRVLDDAQDDAILGQTLYGHVEIQDLTEAQAKDMVDAARRRTDRTQADVDRGKQLIAQGVAPRGFITDSEAELARRKLALELAEERAKLLTEIAAVVHAEIEARPAAGTEAQGPKLAKEFVNGTHGLLSSKDIKDLTLAFEKKFDHPMPVSARGETAVHKALGFDHAGRIDVALLPDSTEGKWLRKYLEGKAIPYYAFRVAIPGKATGAHIHVGPGSTRLLAD